jgi:hypothetical protein
MISPPSWGLDVPLATVLCKTSLLRMLNDSWAGRNPTKGCSGDWRRRRIIYDSNNTLSYTVNINILGNFWEYCNCFSCYISVLWPRATKDVLRIVSSKPALNFSYTFINITAILFVVLVESHQRFTACKSRLCNFKTAKRKKLEMKRSFKA